MERLPVGNLGPSFFLVYPMDEGRIKRFGKCQRAVALTGFFAIHVIVTIIYV